MTRHEGELGGGRIPQTAGAKDKGKTSRAINEGSSNVNWLAEASLAVQPEACGVGGRA